MNMNTQANPNAEPSQSTRDRFMNRLSAERGAPQSPTSPAAGPASDPDPAVGNPGDENEDVTKSPRQPDVQEQGELFEGEDGAVDPNLEEGDGTEPVEGSADYWKLKAEDAETQRTQMEKDYRRKTHRVAETIRDLNDRQEEALAMANFYAGFADQGVKQFENVDWRALQQNPEQYQQARNAFIAAQQYRDRMVGTLEQLKTQVSTTREEALKKQAAVSREVLSSVIPGWNNKVYEQLRDFAASELDYTPAEFNEITDWRRVRDIHAQYIAFTAREKVKSTTTRTTPEKRTTGNVQRPSVRDAQGKYTTARREFQGRPGDKGAARNFFEAKLRNERNRNSR